MEPTVALCMIVRDEQAALPHCLASVASAVDAIYITDTGSTDATLSIARQFGARIRLFPWCDDFSAARNHSIQDIAEDWLLILDADDRFPDQEAGRLRSSLAATSALTLTVDYTVAEGFTPVATRRILRNRSGLHFTGIIHESIRNSLPLDNANHTQPTGIGLLHTGYAAFDQTAKLKRNLPLLQKEQVRCLQTTDAYQQMVIGRELGWTQLQLGETQAGERMLMKLLEAWPADDEIDAYAVEVLATLLWHFQSQHRQKEAWQLCLKLEPHLASQPAFALYRGLAAFQTKHFPEALHSLNAFEQHWLAGRINTPIPLTYTGLGLWDLQGQCCLQLERGPEAASRFAKCLASGGDSQEYAVKMQLARRLTSP